MSYTEGMYAIGDFVTESFAFLRLAGEAVLPFGGIVNWAIISVGVGLIGWWLKQMGSHEEEYEANRPD
jgi:hypothetical protein